MITKTVERIRDAFAWHLVRHLCKLVGHNRHDVINRDLSITHAQCARCLKDAPPVAARPANPDLLIKDL